MSHQSDKQFLEIENAAGHFPFAETCHTEKAVTSSLLLETATRVPLLWTPGRGHGHKATGHLLQPRRDKRKRRVPAPEEGHVWKKAGNSDVEIRRLAGERPKLGGEEEPDQVPTNGVKGHSDTKKVRPDGEGRLAAICAASLDYFKLITEISGVGLTGAREHGS